MTRKAARFPQHQLSLDTSLRPVMDGSFLSPSTETEGSLLSTATGFAGLMGSMWQGSCLVSDSMEKDSLTGESSLSKPTVTDYPVHPAWELKFYTPNRAAIDQSV
jgi:hypothetical protein